MNLIALVSGLLQRYKDRGVRPFPIETAPAMLPGFCGYYYYRDVAGGGWGRLPWVSSQELNSASFVAHGMHVHPTRVVTRLGESASRPGLHKYIIMYREKHLIGVYAPNVLPVEQV